MLFRELTSRLPLLGKGSRSRLTSAGLLLAGSAFVLVAVGPPGRERSQGTHGRCVEDVVVSGVVSATTPLNAGRVGVVVDAEAGGAGSSVQKRLEFVEIDDGTVITGVTVGDSGVDPTVVEGDPIWARACEYRTPEGIRLVAKRLSITLR